jgi:hypothetical protein
MSRISADNVTTALSKVRGMSLTEKEAQREHLSRILAYRVRPLVTGLFCPSVL